MAKKKTTKRRTKRVATKRVAKKRVSKRVTKQARSPRGLAGLSVAQIEAELRRRTKGVAVLERKRDRLLKQLAEVEKQIAKGGGSGGGARRSSGPRPRNAMNLPDSLHAAMKGKTMGVTEAAEAVQKAGYKTTATNFRTIVNQALIRDKRFKKISRGQYRA